jgi:hypothetical protein
MWLQFVGRVFILLRVQKKIISVWQIKIRDLQIHNAIKHRVESHGYISSMRHLPVAPPAGSAVTAKLQSALGILGRICSKT